jgi:hypothetical protein
MMDHERRELRCFSFRRVALLWKLSGGLASGWLGCGTSSPDKTHTSDKPSLQVSLPGESAANPLKSPIVIVAIDALNPAYLELDGKASGPGSPGNWLMPNVRAFLKRTSFWPRARGHAPYATDMNHLNVLAGTNSGLTGVLGVFKQPERWDAAGVVLERTHVSMARYPDGQPVQTLFHLIKGATGGGAKTSFISNKGWVAEMYGASGGQPAVADIIVNGSSYPSYLPAPTYVSWYDNPATDPDAACDPESPKQTWMLDFLSKIKPADHPRDAWIVQAALEVLGRERPDLSYVLLGDLDHAEHFLGEVHDPGEWRKKLFPPLLPAGCVMKPEYLWVSKRNDKLYKEPILDLIRDVDLAFGRLIQGLDDLERQGVIGPAEIVLVSDHNMVNALYAQDIEEKTDLIKMLSDKGLATATDTYWYGAGSMGSLYWRPEYRSAHPQVVAQAKAELLSDAHKAFNPETWRFELPWTVLDQDEMRLGRNDLGIDPQELFNGYFAQNGVWPDLMVLAKNGWSLPSGGFNIGSISLSSLSMNGVHGAPDTSAVVVAIKGLGFPQGIRCPAEARLADVGKTIAGRNGWTLPHTVGHPLDCSGGTPVE